jgi:D-xylulose reductase
MAISLVARGLIDLKPLVTHRFKFEEAVKAFGVTQNGKDEDGKVSSLSSWTGAIDMTRTSG